VVAANARHRPSVTSEFLALSESAFCSSSVTPDGDVQNRILFTEKTYTPSELTMAANFLNRNYAGLTFDAHPSPPARRAEAASGRHELLMTAALEAGSRGLVRLDEDYVISGERNLLDSHELASNMSRLRELFELFERRRCSCRF